MSDVERAVGRIRAWGEARNWRGYDPYDGLNSPAAPALTFGTALGRRLLVQAVKLAPVNIRPVLGVRPEWNAKGIALVASAYARLSAATGDDSAAREAARWLEWLVEHDSGDAAGLAWGYHFDVQTRFFSYRRRAPNTIASSFAAQALLDGVELLGDERWSGPALAAARFLERRMLADDGRRVYFRYLPEEEQLVHNANLLACAVLARCAHVLDEHSLAGPARRALATSIAAQRANGSWPYAEGPEGGWIDNFHTGYVLESLSRCAQLDDSVDAALERGLDFWEDALFLADGTPKYFPHRVLPVDSHCYATAIDTWITVADRRTGALEHAERTARLLVDRMLDPAGFVYFQRRRLWTIRTPFVRWTTAPAFRALAGLMLARRRAGDASRREGKHARLG